MKPDNSSGVSCATLAFRRRRSEMKALLIDQSPQIRQFLEESGLVTIVAENGEAALPLLNQERCSLMICNDPLPDMDVPAFIQQVRGGAFLGYTFILVIVDKAATPDRNSFLVSAGADDVMAGPVSPAELADRLRLAARIVSLENRNPSSASPLSMTAAVNHLLVELLPGVVHEINNPVGFVTGNLSTMEGYMQSIGELAGHFSLLAALLGSRSDLTPKERETLDICKALAAEADVEAAIADVPALLEESRDGMRRIQELAAALREAASSGEEEQAGCDLHSCMETALRVIWNELKYTITVDRQYGEPLFLEAYPSRPLVQGFLMLLAHAIGCMGGAGELSIQTAVENDEALVRVSCSSQKFQEEPCGADPAAARHFFGKCNGNLNVVVDGPGRKVSYTVTIPAPVGGNNE